MNMGEEMSDQGASDKSDQAVSVPCIACGRTLEDACYEPRHNQPYAGTAFTTHGHYGSTVFDPMTGARLELNVCDPCLVAGANDGRVILYSPDDRNWTRWDGQAQ